MNPHIQNKFLELMKENNISFIEIKEFFDYRYKKFLAELFLKSGEVCDSNYEPKIELYRFFLNNSYAFRELEKNVKQFKYVLTYERTHPRSESQRFFCNGWDDLKHYKEWIDSFKDGSFLPNHLIENGKARFDINFKFEYSIKSSLEIT